MDSTLLMEESLGSGEEFLYGISDTVSEADSELNEERYALRMSTFHDSSTPAHANEPAALVNSLPPPVLAKGKYNLRGVAVLDELAIKTWRL